MKYFVGLDVALRSLALCIIDGEGEIVNLQQMTKALGIKESSSVKKRR